MVNLVDKGQEATIVSKDLVVGFCVFVAAEAGVLAEGGELLLGGLSRIKMLEDSAPFESGWRGAWSSDGVAPKVECFFGCVRGCQSRS